MKRAYPSIIGLALATACGSGSSSGGFAPPPVQRTVDAGTPPEIDASGQKPPPVATCSPEGTIETCGQIIVRVGNYETCSTGHHVCQNGVWTECVGDHFVTTLVDAGAD